MRLANPSKKVINTNIWSNENLTNLATFNLAEANNTINFSGTVVDALGRKLEGDTVVVTLDHNQIPVRDEVRGICEVLGLDPLYLANEGKLVVIVKKENADALLKVMKNHPAGLNSAIIGSVAASPQGKVILETGFGGTRILDMLVGEQLPRIC